MTNDNVSIFTKFMVKLGVDSSRCPECYSSNIVRKGYYNVVCNKCAHTRVYVNGS